MALIFGECCMALQSGNRNFLDRAYYKDPRGHLQPYKLLHYSGEYPDTQDALDWLKERADQSSVLAVTMPQWVYLHSGFKAVMPPLTRDPQQAERLIDTVPVSFVVIEQLLMDDNFNTYFPKLVEKSPDHWKLVYEKQGSPVKLHARGRILKSTLDQIDVSVPRRRSQFPIGKHLKRAGFEHNAGRNRQGDNLVVCIFR